MITKILRMFGAFSAILVALVILVETIICISLLAETFKNIDSERVVIVFIVVFLLLFSLGGIVMSSLLAAGKKPLVTGLATAISMAGLAVLELIGNACKFTVNLGAIIYFILCLFIIADIGAFFIVRKRISEPELSNLTELTYYKTLCRPSQKTIMQGKSKEIKIKSK